MPAIPIECTPECGEHEVCATSGSCECGSAFIRDGRGICVLAAPIKCTPECGEDEVCTTAGICACISPLARDGFGNCVPATSMWYYYN